MDNGYAATDIAAVNNWWSDMTGPGGEGPGTGDAVSTHVTYEPWWANVGMTSERWEVKAGESIQDAIDGASDGDVIYLAVEPT